ncbi:hypothetical protein SAMN05660350_03596 [Geodermatophilus obscurus]|uniref:Lipoprotein n=1 Tax=Geodermatophilus obscurus TaxID=1861 RepID=A0A1M7UN55_9ACTN|nr:hypothetical protein [Geodermatophilus obscurus]SHN84451.1 hypothetical protein SAMN05660350_03596 [Geodermatophilus obscurus]
MSGGRAALAVGAVLALTACDGVERACPAIGWGNGLTVELAGDWPPGEGRSVRVDCGTPCDPSGVPGAPPTATAPVEGAVARVVLGMVVPGTVDVTVLGPDSAVLAELSADLEWERVGGSEECGGPHSATVSVPAP